MAIKVSSLTFAPLPGGKPVLEGISFSLPFGARCLCVGRNGAGKSTLLQLLSGQKMAPAGTLEICGEDPFRGRSGQQVVLVSGGAPLRADPAIEERMAQMKVFELLGEELPDATSYLGRLMKVLDVQSFWSSYLGHLSDGQRCRVELVRRLREPKQVVLLDEITAELDMLVRQDLLDFLASESCTVLNVTHVFDACEGWATHLLRLEGGQHQLDALEPGQDIFQRVVVALSADRSAVPSHPADPADPADPAATNNVRGDVVKICELNFEYGLRGAVRVDELTLPASCRCLLLGLNGSGKSTLLNIIAGRRMAKAKILEVLGHQPFQDRALDRELCILSSEWKRQVSQMRGQLTFKDLADAALAELQQDGFDAMLLAKRMLRLVQMLGVEPTKSLGLLSDGGLRRVQLVLKLLKPAKLLLVDEVTADLDVLARDALLKFLKEESEAGCTVVYCTHILDGLQGWATHLLHLSAGCPVQLELLRGAESWTAAVLARLREDRLRPPVPPVTEDAACDEVGLPSGWQQRRSAAAAGAFGNYAWRVEATPQEEWSFKSIAPEPSNQPPAAPAMPAAPVMPVAAPAAVPAVPEPMGTGHGGYAAGPVAPVESGDPFIGRRMNQMRAEELVALGIIPPEK
ncbi:unnamed protein product [Cladocopium goreaui]|uniref:ABC transporter domain-containing protein n=1 Tax=Cladocopium goreaui TaxID=2562237 RepID=A0A9P1CJM6_9DINO|nr:unnamed protein product [Cladocopium goreaui]